MSRYLNLVFAAILVTSMIACETTKLQRDMLEDSTWETSEGEDDWEVIEEPDDELGKAKEPSEAEVPAKDVAEEPKPESHLDEPYERVSRGVIARAELLPVLNEGLGRFLQNVETEPTFHKGAFVGFRIVSLFPGEPAFASLDLRPGDTVTRINGKPIERPEQAIAVWEELRTASTLVVDYRRDGDEHVLQFAIVDES